MSFGLEIGDSWCRYIPLLHRIVADPLLRESFPILSDRFEHSETCAYWETLYYLLTALFGWQRFDKGLDWWYSVNKADQKEPLLRLIQELWDNEEQLDYFAAWAWTQEYCTTPEDISPSAICKHASYGNEDWWRNFKRKGCQLSNNPFYGGTNPLHLGHSQSFGRETNEIGTPMMYFDTAQRKAMVIAGHFTTWRRDLESFGNALPNLSNRSWHVEVFDRHVGFLGLFRRSRDTGLWFIGKHSLHMRGN